MIVRRRRGPLQRRERRPRRLRAALRHPRHRDAGRQGRAALGPSAAARRRRRVRRERRQRRGARRRPRHRHRDAPVGLPDHELVRLAGPRRRASSPINVAELDAAKAAALPLVGDARVTLEELARRARGARLGGLVRGAPGAPSSACASEWNDEVDRVRHLAAPDARLAARGDPPRQRGGRRRRRRGLRRGRPARRPAQDVARLRAGQLSPRVRLLDDGLRDRRRPRRRDGRAGSARVRHGRRRLLPDARRRRSRRPARRASTLTIVLLDNHGFRCIRNLSGVCGGDNALQRLPRPRPGAAARSRARSCPSTSPPTPRASAPRSLTAHDTPAELERGPRGARQRREGGPLVIVVEVEPEPSVPGYDSWWDVPVAEVSESARVQAARRDVRGDLGRERTFV